MNPMETLKLLLLLAASVAFILVIAANIGLYREEKESLKECSLWVFWFSIMLIITIICIFC